MVLLIAKARWHPIAALTTSILWFGIWFSGMFINALVVFSNEIAFDHVGEWSAICYVEAVFQGTFAVLYLVMVWFAAVAVRGWRKEKMGERDRGLEMEARSGLAEEWRREGKVLDVV
ncbi:hypothetical protein K458DRAFT_389019 [Lentithecium fluviatile CBS 122367]|uniref:G-protein coupled receptors family 2 profile 2 domain-containing protein n=1 Tax=Lentithecium fluviatile CBS 122367 TaxID=1168545 RepID=A0A6G1J212_9PLEO|nr:hypothetical protein K458DRAFT_389019 [Lentithecium fluviatile CBS 122367]